MTTLTVRNVPEELATRLKKLARDHGRSMEQEIREILKEKLESRSDLFERIERRAETIPAPDADELEGWIDDGRKRKRA